MGQLNKNSNFQDRLKIAMNEKEIKASELAQKLNMSKQAISAYTTGARSPKFPVMKMIAEVLDVNDMWLMGYDVDKERKTPNAQGTERDERIDTAMNILKSLPDNLLEAALANIQTIANLSDNQGKK